MDSKPVAAEGLPTSTTGVSLGRLVNVQPRTVWANEARDFTPWLRDNPDVLADALGIELALSGSEHPVGAFSLDILGRDLTHDAVLLVENQLEPSDHSHLGQLLTYAAGTGASTVVWVANPFREEHRQALDWLNQMTDETVRFFGVEMEILRIGDSLPAPRLKLVAQPNDWQKQVRSVAVGATAASGRPALYVAFWSRFLERIHGEHPGWTRARAPQRVNWIFMPSPISGIPLSVAFQQGAKLSVELYIDSQDANYNLQLFNRLMAQKDALEQAFGRELTWEEQPSRRYCRVADRTPGEVSAIDDYDKLIDWSFDSIERWRRALSTINPASLPPSPDLGLADHHSGI